MDLLSTLCAGKRSIEIGGWILESQCSLNLLSYSHSIEGRMAKTIFIIWDFSSTPENRGNIMCHGPTMEIEGNSMWMLSDKR